jgi:hypothetical protein
MPLTRLPQIAGMARRLGVTIITRDLLVPDGQGAASTTGRSGTAAFTLILSPDDVPDADGYLLTHARILGRYNRLKPAPMTAGDYAIIRDALSWTDDDLLDVLNAALMAYGPAATSATLRALSKGDRPSPASAAAVLWLLPDAHFSWDDLQDLRGSPPTGPLFAPPTPHPFPPGPVGFTPATAAILTASYGIPLAPAASMAIGTVSQAAVALSFGAGFHATDTGTLIVPARVGPQSAADDLHFLATPPRPRPIPARLHTSALPPAQLVPLPPDPGPPPTPQRPMPQPAPPKLRPYGFFFVTTVTPTSVTTLRGRVGNAAIVAEIDLSAPADGLKAIPATVHLIGRYTSPSPTPAVAMTTAQFSAITAALGWPDRLVGIELGTLARPDGTPISPAIIAALRTGRPVPPPVALAAWQLIAEHAPDALPMIADAPRTVPPAITAVDSPLRPGAHDPSPLAVALLNSAYGLLDAADGSPPPIIPGRTGQARLSIFLTRTITSSAAGFQTLSAKIIFPPSPGRAHGAA